MNALEEDGRKLAKTLQMSPEDIRRLTLETGRDMLKQFQRLPDGPQKTKLLHLSAELGKVWEQADPQLLFAWLAIAWAERH